MAEEGAEVDVAVVVEDVEVVNQIARIQAAFLRRLLFFLYACQRLVYLLEFSVVVLW